VSFGYVSQQYYGRESVAFGRNLHTMVAFTIGTLRELARGIRELRAAFAKRGLLDAHSDPWIKLLDVEDRWDRDETFRKMRDRIAFHVDGEVIHAGLVKLEDERDVELSRGAGRKADGSSLTLGLLAAHNGLGMDLDAMESS